MGVAWCCPTWTAERKKATQGAARATAVNKLQTDIDTLQRRCEAAAVEADTARKEIARLLRDEKRSEKDLDVVRLGRKLTLAVKKRTLLDTAIQGLETQRDNVDTHEIAQFLANTMSSVDSQISNLLSVSDTPQDLAKKARQSQKVSMRLEQNGDFGMDAVAQVGLKRR
jgi:hypothetical protein